MLKRNFLRRNEMKVGIVGAGLVGSTTAYTLAIEGTASEIVLVDINKIRAEAEADDITHATAFKQDCRIIEGDYKDLEGADVVIITADGAPNFNNSRLELVNGNTKMFETIIPYIATYAPFSIIIVTTNPVDVMTSVALKLSGFPENRVIGSGTVLDTARFRSLLGQYLGISPKSLHALVLGEHGDSAVVSWSTARVGAMDIEEFARDMGKELNDANKKKIAEEVVQIAYKIYNGKKATYYGIAGALSTICKAIAKDEKRVLTVSARHGNIDGLHDVCLSLPTVIGKDGVIRTMLPRLSPEEMQKLKTSAEILCGVQQQACALLKEL